MAEVTREMILDYMRAKGGVVKNVDLVRHFRKFLQLSDQRAKGVYRRLFVYARHGRGFRGPKNNTQLRRGSHYVFVFEKTSKEAY